LDDARSIVSIEADIIEALQRKPRHDRAVCSSRNTAERPKELHAVAFPELVFRLCHTS
jgi:hypothetical protein